MRGVKFNSISLKGKSAIMLGAVLVLGAGVFGTLHRTGSTALSLTGKAQAVSTLQTYNESQTKPVAEPQDTSASTSSTSAPAGSTPDTSLKPKVSEVIPDNDDMDASGINCADKMSGARDDYNDKVGRLKTNLDKSISYLGMSISNINEVIKDYNNNVTDLFNQYLAQAASEHCVFPIKGPSIEKYR